MATLRLLGDSAGFVEVKAPSTAGNNTLTLPNSNGNPNQALITNGSGDLSWNDVLLTSGNTITGSVVFNQSATFVSGFISSGITRFASGLISSGTSVFAAGLTSSGTTTFVSGLISSGAIGLNAENSIRFYDADSSNYVGLKAPATIGTNVTWILPSGDGTSNQVLKTDGSGSLSWVTQTQAITQGMSYFYAGF